MTITIQTTIKSPIEKVWESWVNPESVKQWNHATDDWYCPKAVNDLTIGGKFSYTMAARDGSMSFDFWGNYEEIEEFKLIKSTLGDGRKILVEFIKLDDETTEVIESFETEDVNSSEKQRQGWQQILDNFKKYCENK